MEAKSYCESNPVPERLEDMKSMLCVLCRMGGCAPCQNTAQAVPTVNPEEERARGRRGRQLLMVLRHSFVLCGLFARICRHKSMGGCRQSYARSYVSNIRICEQEKSALGSKQGEASTPTSLRLQQGTPGFLQCCSGPSPVVRKLTPAMATGAGNAVPVVANPQVHHCVSEFAFFYLQVAVSAETLFNQAVAKVQPSIEQKEAAHRAVGLLPCGCCDMDAAYGATEEGEAALREAGEAEQTAQDR